MMLSFVLKQFGSGAATKARFITRRAIRWRMAIIGVCLCSSIYANDKALTRMIDVVDAPDTQLVSLDGAPYLVSQWRGTVHVVNFWATWCAPCVKELPSLQKLQDETGVRVITINAHDDLDQIKSYLDEWATPPTMDFVMDKTHEASLRDWRVRVFPTTYVIDKAGKVAFRAQGEREFSSAAIRSQIKELLD